VQNLQTSMPIQSDKELVLYKLVPTSYKKISQHFTRLIVFWCNLAILCKHENILQDVVYYNFHVKKSQHRKDCYSCSLSTSQA